MKGANGNSTAKTPRPPRMDAPLREDLTLFLQSELKVQPSRLVRNARLFHDLGVDGYDGGELIQAFGNRFGVDVSTFNSSLHFGPEAGPNPLLWIWWSVTRTWPKVVPITLGDLENSMINQRWIVPMHAAV